MRREGTIRALAAAATLVLLVAFAGAAAGRPASDDGPTGRYIVVLQDSADPDRVADDHRRSEGARVELVYRHALRGYAATMSAQAAANVSRDPRVAFVEADRLAYATGHGELPTGVDRAADPAAAHTVPAHLTIDGVDDLRVDADVAVIDTGVDAAHPDLHVAGGVDCSGGPWWRQRCGDVASPTDPNGHGTHVAGTIAAIDDGTGVVGIAPGARIWSVRVLGNSGSGYIAWIIAGVDWVTGHGGIEVANMSIGCLDCTSSALDSAIKSSAAAGTAYAIAAGNERVDASRSLPGNVDGTGILTVSALADFDGVSGGLGGSTCRSDQDDTDADFSNFGSEVEIAAPGVCIRSTWPGGGYHTISGTSMAAPHVAGAAALLRSSGKTVAQAHSTLLSSGNSGWVDGSGDGVKEPLLDVSGSAFAPATVAGGGSGGGGGGEDPPPGGNAAPTASIDSVSCSGGNCSFTGSGTDPDGDAVTLSWTGATGSGGSASASYSSPGNYTVTLTATDPSGASGSDSVTVSCGWTGKGKTKSLGCAEASSTSRGNGNPSG